jgi:hypothetical protein
VTEFIPPAPFSAFLSYNYHGTPCWTIDHAHLYLKEKKRVIVSGVVPISLGSALRNPDDPQSVVLALSFPVWYLDSTASLAGRPSLLMVSTCMGGL